MLRIAIVCNPGALADFLTAELASETTICLSPDDPEDVVGFEPDLVLLVQDGEAALPPLFREYPTALIHSPVASSPAEAEERTLRLPFTGADLRGFVRNLVGGKPRPDSEKKPELFADKGGNMEKSEKQSVFTLELTDIVEEGLPLTELDSPADTVDDSGEVSQILKPSDEVQVEEFTLDDFSGDLDELEKEFADSADSDSEISQVAVAVEAEQESAKSLDDDSAALPSGDLDALLSDEEFADIDVREKVDAEDFEDSVLSELKDAGLRAENDLTVNDAEFEELTPAPATEDDVFSFEELDDLEKATASADDVEAETQDAAVPFPEASEAAAATASVAAEETEIPEAETPEDYLLPEDSFSEESLSPEENARLEDDFSTEPDDLVSEQSSVVADAQLDSEPLPGTKDSPGRELSTTAKEATAEIFHEPSTPDFSGEIEGLTREWSKQLLQTTYASMDKMIQAIGDLAPTIVDQVAREVIPPLAEKVIKAEIAKLEAKLEEEEEQP